MLNFWIKEWTMRLIALAALVMAALWGCQTWQESHAFPRMETTTITVDSTPERPQTFIEALRESCMTFGTFILEYQGEKEKYECRRVD